jgi:hypothetical protein
LTFYANLFYFRFFTPCCKAIANGGSQWLIGAYDFFIFVASIFFASSRILRQYMFLKFTEFPEYHLPNRCRGPNTNIPNTEFYETKYLGQVIFGILKMDQTK